MEKSLKKLYTTHEVAKLLGISPITVIRWIEGGKFKCFTTVGGHRRIEHEELIHFAKAYNLPWISDEGLASRREYVVLAVDDEPDMLDLFRDLLASASDLRLIEAKNAFSAGARMVEEHPDLILLDFMMPELDGFEFCRFIRQDPRFKQIPVIAVTGLKNPTDVARMKEAGVNEILTKPFSSEALLEKVEHYRTFKAGLSSGTAPDLPSD